MPIEFNCSACSKLLRVPEGSAGKKAKCPGCQTVLQIPYSPAQTNIFDEAGAMDDEIPELEPPIDRVADPFSSEAPFGQPPSNNPFESPGMASSYQSTSRRAERSGWVTSVAVINFVFGGLQILCGGFILIGASFIAKAAQQDPNLGAEEGAIIAGVILALAILSFALGGASILAGFGIIKRSQWGRILTLVLGGISMLFGVINLIGFNPIALLNFGYGIYVFVVLINSQYAAEFQ